MNDGAAPWVDPELIAAGKLLQEKGLVAPDRMVTPMPEVRAAQDKIGAFLGEGSLPLNDWIGLVRTTVPPPARWLAGKRPGPIARMLRGFGRAILQPTLFVEPFA